MNCLNFQNITLSNSLLFKKINMSEKYDKFITSVISSKGFGSSDFVTQQKKILAGEYEVRDILDIYVNGILGIDKRKKYNKVKVSGMETLFTKRGIKKIRDCRIDIRLHIENEEKEKCRNVSCPPNASKEYSVTNDPWEFIKVMQSWGKYDEKSPKYYLHMVFRYYMNLLHSEYREKGIVLQYPSLQYILDRLYPSTCSNKFPPEFKSFMVDSCCRSINVVSLPVPVKNDGKNVIYDNNFEKIPSVSTLRIRIQSMIMGWKDDKDMSILSIIYPKYLITGDVGNKVIIDAMRSSMRCVSSKKDLKSIKPGSIKMINTIIESVPKISDIYSKYQSCELVTSGEKLKERLGFFLKQSVRSVFVQIKDGGFVDDVFDFTSSSMDKYNNFDLYCTDKTTLPFINKESGEGDCRNLLNILECIVHMFHLKGAIKEDDVDPDKIVTDAIKLLCGNSN